MKQRISFSVQNPGNRRDLLAFIARLKPTTIGVMDDPTLLREIMGIAPSIEVGWYRPYRDDDGNFWRLGDEPIAWLIAKWNASGLRGVPNTFITLMNEPAAGDTQSARALVNWTVHAMRALRNAGIRAVVMNAQPAVFDRAFVDGGIFDPLLAELSDGYHLLGWHEYGGAFPAIGAAGGNKYHMLDPAKMHPSTWPTRAQVHGPASAANWLVGRYIWWDQRAVAKGYNRPLKVMTEAGQDALGVYADIDAQLKQRYGVSNGHHTTRGWDSWANVYKTYYNGVFPEPIPDNTQLAFMKWWDDIYDETVLGINFFVWSPNAYDWDTQFGFDYSKSLHIQQGLINWTAGLGNTTPQPPSNPGPIAPPPNKDKARIAELLTVLESTSEFLSDTVMRAQALHTKVEKLLDS